MQLAQFLHQLMAHPGHMLIQMLSQDASLISRIFTGHVTASVHNLNMGDHSPLHVVPSSSVNWNLGPAHVPYAPQLHVQPPTNSQPGLSPFGTHFNPQVRQ